MLCAELCCYESGYRLEGQSSERSDGTKIVGLRIWRIRIISMFSDLPLKRLGLSFVALITIAGFCLAANASEPDIQASEVKRRFFISAFGDESPRANRPEYQIVRKFESKILYGIWTTSSPNINKPYVYDLIESAFTDLSEILPDIDIREAGKEKPNFFVFMFSSFEERKKKMEKFGHYDDIYSADCSFIFFSNNTSTITTSIVYLVLSDDKIHMNSCVYSEIVQALGLPTDSDTFKNSLFNEFDDTEGIPKLEEVVIKILYDPEIRAGMTAAQVLEVFDGALERAFDSISQRVR
jgi:hypothetical protein